MKNKNMIIILIILVLCVFSIVFYLIMGNKKNIAKYDNGLVLVNDNSDFFTVQNIINQYYDILKTNDSNSIIRALDEEYLQSKSITNENVLNVINTKYQETSYIAKKMYSYETRKLTYYFVNGLLLNEFNDDTEQLTESNESIQNVYENVNYMVILNEKSFNYAIYPLENNNNFEDFIKTYNLKNNDNLTNKYTKLNIKDEVKLSSYINYFLTYLLLKPELAYDLLSDNAKKEYTSVEELIENRDSIFEKLTSVVFSYTTESNNKIKEYDVKDNNLNSINIKEKNLMDYTIEFKYYITEDYIEEDVTTEENNEEIYDY